MGINLGPNFNPRGMEPMQVRDKGDVETCNKDVVGATANFNSTITKNGGDCTDKFIYHGTVTMDDNGNIQGFNGTIIEIVDGRRSTRTTKEFAIAPTTNAGGANTGNTFDVDVNEALKLQYQQKFPKTNLS